MIKAMAIFIIMVIYISPGWCDTVGDINDDEQIGLEEAVYALQVAAGVKDSRIAPKTILKVPSAFQSSMPVLGSTIKWVTDRIELLSNGRLKFELYEPGVLIPASKIIDEVSNGNVEAGYSWPGYWGGRMPAAYIFSGFPFGPEAGEFLAWLWYGNAMSLWQEIYDEAGLNVKVLACGIIGPETGGWFKTEINSPEDFNGLKMRFFGLGAEVMKKMGVTIVSLPGSGIYDALKNGTIDAVEFSIPIVDLDLKLYEVTSHNYFPGWHQKSSVLELLINKDVWNGLTDHQRMVIEISCKAATSDCYAYAEAIQGQVVKDNQEIRGVTNHYWSDEVLNSFRNAWSQVLTEQIVDPKFNKVWNDFTAFHDIYSNWSSVAFLPRR